MDVGIVTVGDELLTGDTVNTNATWLCTKLSERGVRVRRVVVVPDEVEEIATAVADIRVTTEAVLVTGGLGPTHDDVTMEAIARVFDRPLAENDEVRGWLVNERDYTASDLAPGTVQLPAGATPLHNDVGVAPGARIEEVYVLPGVPAEMQAMFDRIVDAFEGPSVYRETVRAAEPESTLLDRFEHLQSHFDVHVGSYPGEHVRVVLAGGDPAEVSEAAAWLRDHVTEVPPEEEPETDSP